MTSHWNIVDAYGNIDGPYPTRSAAEEARGLFIYEVEDEDEEPAPTPRAIRFTRVSQTWESSHRFEPGDLPPILAGLADGTLDVLELSGEEQRALGDLLEDVDWKTTDAEHIRYEIEDAGD